MKHESHLDIDVTVPFTWSPSTNVLEAPHWLQELVYPRNSTSNPLSAFLENVKAPSNVRVNIHITIEPSPTNTL